MTSIAVTSWRGIGTTTSALLLGAASAAADPSRSVLVIEADPAGGVLAARSPVLQGRAGGLNQVAFPVVSMALREQWAAAAVEIGDASVVPGIGDSFQAWSAVAAPTSDWIGNLSKAADLVIVDIGTVRGQSPAWRIACAADLVVAVCSPDPVSVVSTLEWGTSRGKSMPGVEALASDTARLLVVDAPVVGRERFDAATVSAEVGDRLIGWWPWDPALVDSVLRGAGWAHRSVRRSPLAAAVSATAATLAIGSTHAA